jgi:hypothetical protein
MSFQFIKEGEIDIATRKVIRSHVMKGKNVGKIRPRTRKEKRELFLSCETSSVQPQISNLHESAENVVKECISIPRTPGNIYAFSTFPCGDMQPYMINLIYQCKRKQKWRGALLNLSSPVCC